MSTDTAARDAAWAERVGAACREYVGAQFWNEQVAHATVFPGPSEWVDRMRERMSRAIAAADAIAPAPVVPDEVRQAVKAADSRNATCMHEEMAGLVVLDWARSLLAAPAQPADPLEERAAVGDELAVPLWDGPARSAWDEKDRRIRELERVLRSFVRIADKGLFRDRAELSLAAHPIMDDARTILQGDGNDRR